MNTPAPVGWNSLVGAGVGATLVIGYGNELRSDDGAGVWAATRLGARFPQSRVIVVQQLSPELADEIAAAAQVVFLDAYAASGADAPLRVERIRGDDAADIAEAASTLGHHGDPARLVGLAERLYGRAPDVWVVGIPAFCFAAGETISPATMRMVDQAVALLTGCVFGEKGDAQ